MVSTIIFTLKPASIAAVILETIKVSEKVGNALVLKTIRLFI